MSVAITHGPQESLSVDVFRPPNAYPSPSGGVMVSTIEHPIAAWVHGFVIGLDIMNFQLKHVKGESSEGIPQEWIEVRRQVSHTDSVTHCIPCTEDIAGLVIERLSPLLLSIFQDGERSGKDSIRASLRDLIGCSKSR